MKRLVCFILIVICQLSIVGFVFAHGIPFFQFLPDTFTTSSLNILTSGIVSQIFIPQNDFLGGMDLWFSNGDDSSPATIKFYNSNDILLFTKSITLPAIADIPGGQKVHIDFGQLSVNSTSIYRAQIEVTNPSVRLYYAPRTKLLEHNSPAVSAYQNGAARIDNEEKEFSFLFGLYEGTETAPPVISNVSSSVISPTEAWVNFNSNEPVDYKVQYGPQGQGYTQTSQFNGSYDFCAQGVDTCRRQLVVSGGIDYDFLLTVKDSWGNQSTATGTFTTPTEGNEIPSPTPSGSVSVTPIPGPDTIPPVISNFRVVALNNNSIQLAWTTDEPANSSFLIQNPAFITIAAGSDAVLELEHFTDSGNVLGAGAPYIISVTSRDAANNLATRSLSFTTKTQATPTPSTTPSATPTPAQSAMPSLSPNTPVVSWNPAPGQEPPGGYRVDVFDSSNRFIETIKLTPGTHNLTLEHLPDGQYTIVTYASSGGAFKKVSAPQKINIDRRSFLEKLLTTKNILIFLGIVILIILVTVIVIKKQRQTPIPPV